MRSLSVAILGDTKLAEELAGKLGKKGNITEITQYDCKKDDKALTIVTASRFPEKIQSLIFGLAMSEFVVLITDKIDRSLGETIISIEAFKRMNGLIILENFLARENIAPFINGTCMEKWPIFANDKVGLQNKLFTVLSEMTTNNGTTKIPVDQVFNVRGVGTVALGTVTRGAVKIHDTLEVFPKGKKAIVRSIQVHDHDVTEALMGSRVGLALKNVETEDVSKGDVLAVPGTMKTGNTFTMALQVTKFFKEAVAPGMVMHAMCSLDIKPVKIKSLKKGDKDADSLKAGEMGLVTIESEVPFAYDGDDVFVLSYLEAKGPRIVGRGVLA